MKKLKMVGKILLIILKCISDTFEEFFVDGYSEKDYKNIRDSYMIKF